MGSRCVRISKSLRVIKIYSILFTLQLFAGSYTCLTWYFFQVDLTSSFTSYNLSSDLKRSKRARWQGDKSTCQIKLVKLTILSSRTCHRKWNLSPNLSPQVEFVIQTICHITPWPHPFHCTNSHEATQVVHRKWGSIKREDSFIIIAEHPSEFVDCE